MAVPAHHPPAELLLDHSGGCSSEAEALMIARHLELCPECCAGVRDCAAIGGALLDSIEPARLPLDLLNRTLEAIDSSTGTSMPEPPMHAPAVLDSDAGSWRKLPGGVSVRRLPVRGPERLVLMRIKPGGSVLRHRHVGEEWTLVLQGGFSDDAGHYGRGDLVVKGAEEEHRPVADRGEDCVCLVLLRGEPRYSGPLGGLMRLFVKL